MSSLSCLLFNLKEDNLVICCVGFYFRNSSC